MLAVIHCSFGFKVPASVPDEGPGTIIPKTLGFYLKCLNIA